MPSVRPLLRANFEMSQTEGGRRAESEGNMLVACFSFRELRGLDKSNTSALFGAKVAWECGSRVRNLVKWSRAIERTLNRCFAKASPVLSNESNVWSN